MATATLLPLSGSSAHFELTASIYSVVGTADPIIAVSTAGDGKYIQFASPGFGGQGGDFSCAFDASALPIDAVITALEFRISHRNVTGDASDGFVSGAYLWNTQDADVNAAPAATIFDVPHNDFILPTSGSFSTWVTTFDASVHPITGNPWTVSDFVTTWIGVEGAVSIDPAFYYIDYMAVVVTYTPAVVLNWYYNATTDEYFYGGDPGSPWLLQAAAPVPLLPTAEVPNISYSGTTSPRNGTATVATPANGCAGTPVTLIGSGFGTGATVTFGGVSATSVVVVDQHTITCVAPAHADGAVDIVVTNPDTTTVTFTNGYTYGTPWWTRFVTEIVNGIATIRETHTNSCTAPALGTWTQEGQTTPADTWWYNATTGTYRHQVGSPGDAWTASGSGPAGDSDTSGWYDSTYGYGGSIDVIANGRPKDPRVWANIATWATGNTGCFGGSPAASCIFQNHLVYPATYTVATDYPPIRVHNGSFDRELCRLPPTTAGTIPKAVLSMIAAGGTIYLTTFDSGTTSADWRGRVFQLDLDSGNLTLLGAQFAAGEMPYALAWHLGRLWCGTNNGIGTVGKVYSFRPGIDTAWVLEHSLATDSVGGVCSMLSFNGKLYIGSDAAAGTFAKILVRDGAGAYTTSETGTGGTARVNNAFLALTAFGTNLYASYFNNDTTKVSQIRKFDGTTWTTVYSGASATLRPYIGLLVDGVTLFAIGGGMSLAASLVSTLNGTSWTDLTPQLPETNRTFQPIFGTVVL